MNLTVTVIKADSGSVGGHIMTLIVAPHVCAKVRAFPPFLVNANRCGTVASYAGFTFA